MTIDYCVFERRWLSAKFEKLIESRIQKRSADQDRCTEVITNMAKSHAKEHWTSISRHSQTSGIECLPYIKDLHLLSYEIQLRQELKTTYHNQRRAFVYTVSVQGRIFSRKINVTNKVYFVFKILINKQNWRKVMSMKYSINTLLKTFCGLFLTKIAHILNRSYIKHHNIELLQSISRWC